MIYGLEPIPTKFNSPKSTPLILTFSSYHPALEGLGLANRLGLPPFPSVVPLGSLDRGSEGKPRLVPISKVQLSLATHQVCMFDGGWSQVESEEHQSL